MNIAETIKENNIAEYILFMWQTEDLIRGFNLDVNTIESNIIDNIQTENLKSSTRNWYLTLVKDLKLQGKTKKGHLNEVNEVLNELNYLHATLINLMQDPVYTDIYKTALPYINDFKDKSQENEVSDVQLCLNALYGKLILKLKGKEISKGTEDAFKQFRNVLAHLSVKYKDMKAGTLTIKNEKS